MISLRRTLSFTFALALIALACSTMGRPGAMQETSVLAGSQAESQSDSRRDDGSVADVSRAEPSTNHPGHSDHSHSTIGRSPSNLPQQFASVNEAIPKVEVIRAEIEKDSHGTPESILRFSIELGQHTRIAAQNEDSARAFFTELEVCIDESSPKGMHAVAALCLYRAKELSAKYTPLEPAFQRLSEKTDKRSRTLIERVETGSNGK